MKRKLTFLGSGGSLGVPILGCPCPVCHSPDPLNKRLRPSVLLHLDKKQFLIDAGPDFRQQALRHNITRLDGVIITHAHYDHTAGIDDLRPLYYWNKARLPFLLSSETAEDIRARFHYLFESMPGLAPIDNRFDLQILPDRAGEVLFEGILMQYVSYTQSGMLVNGFRFGNLAYLSDIRHFSPAIFEHLKGVKYLIISALRYTASPIHFSVDEAIDFSRQIKAERVWFTHIAHDLEHHKTNAYLPANITLAYDGLEIEFD